jgi:hypothetical protein
VVLPLAKAIIVVLAVAPLGLATWHLLSGLRRGLRLGRQAVQGLAMSIGVLVLAVLTYSVLRELWWDVRDLFLAHYLATLSVLPGLALLGFFLAAHATGLPARRRKLLRGSLLVALAGLTPLAALAWLTDFSWGPWPGLFLDHVYGRPPVALTVVAGFTSLAFVLSLPLLTRRSAQASLLVGTLSVLEAGALASAVAWWDAALP